MQTITIPWCTLVSSLAALAETLDHLHDICDVVTCKLHACLCDAQTGVLEYPTEDSMTTMKRVKRFLQRKDGAPGTPAKTPQAASPKQKGVKV